MNETECKFCGRKDVGLVCSGCGSWKHAPLEENEPEPKQIYRAKRSTTKGKK